MKRLSVVPVDLLPERGLPELVHSQEAERSTELLPQVNYAAPTKQCGRPGQRGKPGGSGSGGGWLAKDADKQKLAKDGGPGGGGRRRECSCERRPHRESKPRKENQSSKSTLSKDADSSSGGKGQGNGEASCSLVGIVEPTFSLAPEASVDFQAVAAAMKTNPAVVLLESGCSHHLMGTKEAFVNLGPSGDVKHVRGFKGALQTIQGCGTVALQGEARKHVLIPDVLYVPGVHANLLSAGQLKERNMNLQDEGDGMLIVSVAGDVLGQATYTGQVLCTDLRPYTATSTLTSMETVATGLDVKPSNGTDSMCVSCVGGKLARHTFPNKGSDADEALAVVHIDLCGPFLVAAKNGSLYFLLLKDRKTRYVWVRPVAKKSDVLREFAKWSVFTAFVDDKGIIYDDTCPYTLQLNGMVERHIGTVVESVRTMLLHMGVQHHWGHLALRQAVWVRNCMERSTLPPGTTPHQLLTGKKPDLTLAHMWGCMAQFLILEQQRGGKLKPKDRRGLHLGVSEESKGWELLDLTDNRVVTTSDVVFYETMSLEVWKSEHGPIGEPAAEDAENVLPSLSSPAPCAPPLVAGLQKLTLASASGDEGSSGTSPVALAKSIAGVRCDVEQVEQRVERKQPTLLKSVKKVAAEEPPTGKQPTGMPTKELSFTKHSAREPMTGEKSAGTPNLVHQDDKGSKAGDHGGEHSGAEQFTDSDVGESKAEEPRPRRSGRLRRPPKFLTYHACLPPAAFTTLHDDEEDEPLYDDAEDDVDLPKLNLDMHADPEHRNDDGEGGVGELEGQGSEGRHGRRDPYYVTLRIFLSIVAVLDLNQMKLDMKNAFLQSKLDRVLYMYQPDYYNDGTGRTTAVAAGATGDSRSNSSGLSSSSGSGSSTGGRSCSSGGFSCNACSNLYSGALMDPAGTHTGASEVLSVGAAATTRLVPAFVAGSGATSPTARLSFTLDVGASSCFFRDCTNLTPLHTPVIVALADPSVGSVVVKSTTTLSCPAAPSRFLTSYYTPSFSTNLVGVSHLHDLGVVTTFPLHEPVASYTVSAIGAPLATFHKEPGSGLYSLHTESHHTGSGQVRSDQVAAVSCDCRSLTHPSVLWHHRLGHPSFPHLNRMVRHRLVSGLSESLAPLPRSPAPPCTPCVEGRQRAAPHSSFPPTTASLQTLHLDVWGPSPVLGPRQERYFLIVVDDYSRYTTVFPLRRKADVLIARGGVQGLCGLRIHSNRGGELSSTRLETFCQGRGIVHPPPVAPVAPPPSCHALSGAVAEGEGTRAAGARRANSGGAGGVRVETTPEEDKAVSTQRPRPTSPPDFLSVPQFPPRSPPRPIAAKPGGVPAGGTRVPGGVVYGGSASAGAGDTSIATPMPRTVRFVTRVQRLDRLEREEWERGGVTAAAAAPAEAAVAVVSVGASGDSRGGPQQERVEQESRPQQQVLLQPQQDRVEEEPQEQQGGQVPQQQSPEEAEQQQLKYLPDSAPARFVRGPLPSPPVPPVESLCSSQWTSRSPLIRDVSPEPRWSRYRANGPFHLVLRSHVLPPPVLPRPPESSLTVFHDPLSDYLCASCPVVSCVLSASVTHPTAPLVKRMNENE
ncbi:unnamed protein product [Closterium sp. NIES-53]